MIAQHPWIEDVEEELRQVEKEEQEELEKVNEYSGAFITKTTSKGTSENNLSKTS